MTKANGKKMTAVFLTLLLMTSMTVSGNAAEEECTDHEYWASVTDPTCLSDGYTTYTCELCGDTYTGDYVDYGAHDYRDWRSCGDDTHEAFCIYCGRSAGTVENCELYSWEFGDETNTVCAVCGAFGDEKAFDAVDVTYCSSDEDVIVRGMEDPCGKEIALLDGYTFYKQIDYAFTVTTADGAELEEDTRLTIPYLNTGNFTLLKLNEDDEWVKVNYTYKNNRLSFSMESTGLFLIVS